MRIPSSLRLRLIAAAAFWCVAGLAGGGYALSEVFSDYVGRNVDARLTVLLDGLIAGSGAGEAVPAVLRPPADPRFAAPYGGLYWQVDGPGGPVERSRSLWDHTLSGGAGLPLLREAEGPNGQWLRIAARDIALPGLDGRVLFQVAVDKAEAEAEIASFNRLLIWTLAALGIGLVGAVVLQVRVGLRPLEAMGGALARIRAGGAERLEGDFPVEVKPLADELNGLLEHNRRMVERARREAGDLAHALKTPLSVLANEAGRTPGPLADQVTRQVAAMRGQVDHHLARARAAAAAGTLGARSDVAPVAEGLLRVMRRLYEERGIVFESAVDAGLAFAGERQDLEEMLGNLLDNAGKWAAGRVVLRAAAASGRLVISVADDGPGLDAAAREAALQRGRRLDETVPGAGLGLSIAADLAELYAGELDLAASDAGGLDARLTLPLA
jgi:signal transduction histidine kinase